MAFEDFNTTVHGSGLEGFINWTNILSDGWMISLFLVFIGVGVYIVGKNKGINRFLSLAMAGFLVVLLSPIFQLFTTINSQVVIAGLIAGAVGVGGYFIGK